MNKLKNLIQIVSKIAKNGKTDTGVPNIAVVQGEIPQHKLAGVYEPMINLVIQGSKTLNIGNQRLHYNPSNYFIMSIDLPATGQVFSDATTGKPYMAIAFTFKKSQICEFLEKINIESRKDSQTAFGIEEINDQLLDVWLRLMRLTQNKSQIEVLAPLYTQELIYLTLLGSQGQILRDVAIQGTTLNRVHKAVDWVRSHYAETISIKKLAELTDMSEATLFRKFKNATSLTPIQYQKQLRLLEARRLLLETQNSIGNISFQVGYESPSQFSRDYSKFFKTTPSQDIVFGK